METLCPRLGLGASDERMAVLTCAHVGIELGFLKKFVNDLALEKFSGTSSLAKSHILTSPLGAALEVRFQA